MQKRSGDRESPWNNNIIIIIIIIIVVVVVVVNINCKLN
jgi:t-SNARE complex subunit (syntaxin)